MLGRREVKRKVSVRERERSKAEKCQWMEKAGKLVVRVERKRES